jgi:cobalamin biosynthesis Co2+ chelatase CbiK
MCIFSFSRGVSISIDHIFKFNYDFKKCDDFIDTVRSKGVELVELVYLAHESGDHVFDMRNNDEQSHSIIKKTVEFIKNMLTKTHQIVAPDIFMLCPRKRDKK